MSAAIENGAGELTGVDLEIKRLLFKAYSKSLPGFQRRPRQLRPRRRILQMYTERRTREIARLLHMSSKRKETTWV